MSFFTSGFFWFIEGILACLVVLGFKTWMEDRNTPMTWWKWLLFGTWLLIFGFTIAFITTSAGENEMAAATKGGIIFALFTVISGAGLWRVINIGRVKETKSPEPVETVATVTGE